VALTAAAESTRQRNGDLPARCNMPDFKHDLHSWSPGLPRIFCSRHRQVRVEMLNEPKFR
jgi:hypothetical protein